MKLLSGLLLVLLSATLIPAMAELVDAASVDQFVERLEVNKPTTRSLRNLVVSQPSIDLMIQFDFDSAKIQEASKPLLNNLAVAMKREKLANLKFNVEGHTDAKGAADYNIRLSGRRAESVTDYLVQRGIDKVRLNPVGKGAKDLLYPEQPTALENRRVRISTDL